MFNARTHPFDDKEHELFELYWKNDEAWSTLASKFKKRTIYKIKSKALSVIPEEKDIPNWLAHPMDQRIVLELWKGGWAPIEIYSAFGITENLKQDQWSRDKVDEIIAAATRQKWSTVELKILLKCHADKGDVRSIAKDFGRSELVCTAAIYIQTVRCGEGYLVTNNDAAKWGFPNPPVSALIKLIEDDRKREVDGFRQERKFIRCSDVLSFLAPNGFSDSKGGDVSTKSKANPNLPSHRTGNTDQSFDNGKNLKLRLMPASKNDSQLLSPQKIPEHVDTKNKPDIVDSRLVEQKALQRGSQILSPQRIPEHVDIEKNKPNIVNNKLAKQETPQMGSQLLSPKTIPNHVNTANNKLDIVNRKLVRKEAPQEEFSVSAGNTTSTSKTTAKIQQKAGSTVEETVEETIKKIDNTVLRLKGRLFDLERLVLELKKIMTDTKKKVDPSHRHENQSKVTKPKKSLNSSSQSLAALGIKR